MSTRPVVPAPEAVEAHFAQSLERRRSGRRIIWGIIIGFVLLLMLTPLVLYLAWQARGRSLLRQQLAAIKATGDPLTTTEMAAWHTVPEGTRDITGIWVAAIAPFDSPNFNATINNVPVVGNATVLPALDQPIPAAEEKTIRDFLALHKDKIAALHTAAAEEGEVRYERDFRKGVAMLLPEAQQIRSASRVLELEFELLARGPSIEPAIDNLITRIKAGETLRHEPLLISMLVRIAVHSSTISDILQLAETGKCSDDQLAQLQRLLRGLDIHEQMPSAILGERAWCYHAFHQPIGFTGPSFDGANNVVRDTSHDVSEVKRPEDCAKALEIMTELKGATNGSHQQMLDTFAKFDDQVRELRGGNLSVNRFRYMVTTMILPALQSVAFADARGDAQKQLADAAIAVRRYHLKHKQGPHTLSDLVPDFLPTLPVDSFDGQPLRLKFDAEKIILYSIGKDRMDNGGECDPARLEPDIAVEVTLPK